VRPLLPQHALPTHRWQGPCLPRAACPFVHSLLQLLQQQRSLLVWVQPHALRLQLPPPMQQQLLPCSACLRAQELVRASTHWLPPPLLLRFQGLMELPYPCFCARTIERVRWQRH